MSKPPLTLLTRPGCHLCHEFREELEAALPGRYRIEERCVDDDPRWREVYGSRIPVLLSGDAVLAEGRFDASAFARARGAAR